MPKALRTDLHKLAATVNVALLFLPVAFFAAGYFISFYFHFLTVASLFLLIVNFFYRHIQKEHTILRNFGILGQGRYLIESLGPEFRQYWFMGDKEERPFNRLERAEVYRKAKNVDSVSSFGSLMDYDIQEIKLRHSMFPTSKKEKKDYRLVIGEERGVAQPYTLRKPIMVSAMSFGSLGSHAIRSIARGAAEAGIPMNCGEGGYPKYHFKEEVDVIFQLGTAKFGVRDDDGNFDESKLQEIAAKEQTKMVEIKFSQGAKPGKGGLLPKEKISKEIAEMRGIPQGEDAVSPPFHSECVDLESTVGFIDRIQKLVQIPVGCKMCIGSHEEFAAFVDECIRQDVFPDWISIDGGEGGTGAAPKTFVDYVGMPLFPALHGVVRILEEKKVRDRVKVFAAGKLINAARQSIAFALGADAIYTARGFMLALGCIQSRECGANTCPVGIATQDPKLQAGLVIEDKAPRVKHYIENTLHDLDEVVRAMGKKDPRDMTVKDLYVPTGSTLHRLMEDDPALQATLNQLDVETRTEGARNHV